MINNKTYLGAISVAVAAALWGLSGVIFIPHLSNLPTSFVVFLMHFLPFIFLTIFFYKQYKYVKIFTKIDWFILILISLSGAILGTIAIVKALFLVNFHHLSVVVLLQKLQPIFAILLAHLILKERISRHFVLLTIIILCGGYFLTFGLNTPAMGKIQQLFMHVYWHFLQRFVLEVQQSSVNVLQISILQLQSRSIVT